MKSRIKKDKIVPNRLEPLTVLKEAITVVPAVKYALGIAGVGAAVAIIKTLITDLQVAVFGIVLMLVLMTVLFIFAKLATIAGKDIRAILLALIWFSLFLFIATAACLFTSVFFKWPVNLQHWITGFSPITSSTVTAPGNINDQSQAREFDLTGQVREEGGVVPDVEILEINSGQRTTSDSQGKFILKLRQIGNNSIRVRASKDGYITWEEYVEIQPGLIILLRRNSE